MNSPRDELCPPPSADDDDLTLPRASINKMIKELVSNWLKLICICQALVINIQLNDVFFGCCFFFFFCLKRCRRYEWRTKVAN